MEDHVVNLIVSMNRLSAIFRLGLTIGEECDHVVEMRDLPNRLLCIDIYGLGLRGADRAPCAELPRIEPRRLAVGLQAHVSGIDPVEFGYRSNRVMPPII